MASLKKIIIAGGGSGGHLFPALSIADALVEQDFAKEDITFFGSKYSLEKDIVPKCGYKIELFSGRGINNLKSPSYFIPNILNVLGLIVALFKSLYLIHKIKPTVVIGVGGFASFPAICSAVILRKKIVVHEQNAVLGRINKIAQQFGAQLLTTFTSTEGANEDAIQIGLPLRKEVLGLLLDRNNKTDTAGGGSDLPHSVRRGADPNKRIVTIFGGSLGAKCINDAVIQMVNTNKMFNFDLTLITGEKNFDSVSSHLKKSENANVNIIPFSNNLFEMILNSDLVVSRAGAGTCVELEAAGVKSILIPLAIAPGDHQRKNAHDIVANGNGVLLDEKDLNGISLYSNIVENLENNTNIGKTVNSIHLIANIEIAKYIINRYLV